MPQMSPILWMNLYATFTVILVTFIALSFYTKTPSKSPLAPLKKTKKNFNWKW